MQKRQQQMLGADALVIQQLALLLRVDDDATGTIGEQFEHVASQAITTLTLQGHPKRVLPELMVAAYVREAAGDHALAPEA